MTVLPPAFTLRIHSRFAPQVCVVVFYFNKCNLLEQFFFSKCSCAALHKMAKKMK